MSIYSAAMKAWETRRRMAAERSNAASRANITRKFNDYKALNLSDWHASEAAGALAKKSAQRKRVERFILKNHPKGPIHLLSFPGSRWEMERSLLGKRSDSKFTGIERDKRFVEAVRDVIDASAPGGKMHNSKRDKILCLENGTATLLLTPAGKVGNVPDLNGVSAIWADFMGKLDSSDFAAFIAALPKIVKDDAIPVVFTVYKGRERFFDSIIGSYNPETVRVKFLTELLAKNGLTLKRVKSWAYKSDIVGSGQMLNIAGILSRSENSDIKLIRDVLALCGSHKVATQRLGLNSKYLAKCLCGRSSPGPIVRNRLAEVLRGENKVYKPLISGGREIDRETFPI